MAKHIDHLEDILFERGSVALAKILNDPNKTVTLKWDGSPAVVAGVHPEQGCCMVATKSYFNKIPVWYGGAAAIELSPLDESLKRKLLHVWDNHPETAKGHGKGYLNQGDLLWVPGSFVDLPSGHRSFRPNVIEYRVPLDIIGEREVGVVWHTDLVGKGLYQKTHNMWSGHIVTQAPLPEYIPDEELDEVLKDREFAAILNEYVKYCYRKSLEPSQMLIALFDESVLEGFHHEYVSKWKSAARIEKAVKQLETSIYSRPYCELVTLERELQKIQNYKKQVLDNLETGIETYVQIDGVDIPCQHEGWVIQSKYGLAKVVDRVQFTRFNKLDNITRGWQKG